MFVIFVKNLIWKGFFTRAADLISFDFFIIQNVLKIFYKMFRNEKIFAKNA